MKLINILEYKNFSGFFKTGHPRHRFVYFPYFQAQILEKNLQA